MEADFIRYSFCLTTGWPLTFYDQSEPHDTNNMMALMQAKNDVEEREREREKNRAKMTRGR